VSENSTKDLQQQQGQLCWFAPPEEWKRSFTFIMRLGREKQKSMNDMIRLKYLSWVHSPIFTRIKWMNSTESEIVKADKADKENKIILRFNWH